MRTFDLTELKGILLDSILENDSMKEMFEKAYAYMRLPLNAFDTSFKLIANAFERPFYFKDWEEMAVNDGAPQATVSSSNYLDYQEKMYSMGRTQIFDYGNCEGYPQACGPVFVDGVLVAYMGTMIEDADPDLVVKANDAICEAMSSLMRRNSTQAFGRTGSLRGEWILMLGDFRKGTAAEFASRFPPPYTYVRLEAKSNAVSTLTYVKYILSAEPNGMICELSNEFGLHILLCSVPASDRAAQLKMIASIAEKYDLYAGVSDSFSDISEIKTYERQAMLALSLLQNGDGEGRIQSFLALYPDILCLSAAECAADGSFVEPKLRAVFDDDRIGQESLLTLETFLRTQKRTADTAKILGIHKNTVLQRISKIAEAAELDFSDPKAALGVLLQIGMYKTAGISVRKEAET